MHVSWSMSRAKAQRVQAAGPWGFGGGVSYRLLQSGGHPSLAGVARAPLQSEREGVDTGT